MRRGATTLTVLLATSASAIATPTAPGPFEGVPEFLRGPVNVLTVAAALPQGDPVNAPGVIANYQWTLVGGGPGVRNGVTTSPNLIASIEDGREYSVSVFALEQLANGVLQIGSNNRPVSFTADNTPPSGSFTITGGAVSSSGGVTYSRSRNVTLSLNAADPAPGPGLRASGVATYQATDTDFTCEPLTFRTDRPAPNRAGCQIPYTPSAPFTLVDGQDGQRSVSVVFRDAADDQRKLSLSLQQRSALITGNASPVQLQTLFLDRVAPTPAVVFATAVAGQPLIFTASDSADGDGDPARNSGIDPASYSWTFGDGTTGNGRRVSHVYAAAGTYQGTLAIRDRAGNTAAQPIRVVVAGTSGGPSPGGGVTAGSLRLRDLKVPRLVAGRRAKLRVSVNAATRLDGRFIRFSSDGRTATARRFSTRLLSPGQATMTVRAPRAGRYRLEIRAGAVVLRTRVRVAAAKPRARG